jgi:aspartyl-tRNA(Asn)/glutamyl-tRNA(Gln) amidotransferase subunit A
VSELTAKTIAELRDGLRGRDFSAREVAEAYNSAVEAAKLLNAYTVTTPDDPPGVRPTLLPLRRHGLITGP